MFMKVLLMTSLIAFNASSFATCGSVQQITYNSEGAVDVLLLTAEGKQETVYIEQQYNPNHVAKETKKVTTALAHGLSACISNSKVHSIQKPLK